MKKDPVANSTKISVTFEAPAEIQAESLAVVGEFNEWDATAAPMKRRKDGVWAKTLRLEPGTYATASWPTARSGTTTRPPMAISRRGSARTTR